ARVRASAAGHRAEVAALSTTSDAAVELALEPLASIEGHVFDAEGKPAAGAEVRSSREPGERATTDAEGRFRVPSAAPPPGRPATLVALRGGSAPAGITVTDLAPVTLRLARPAAVEGVVLDARGDPVAGVAIHLDMSLTAWHAQGTPLATVMRLVGFGP